MQILAAVIFVIVALGFTVANNDEVLALIRSKSDILEKYSVLSRLHATNRDDFFKLVIDNIDEMVPIYYTPGVGVACQNYGRIPEESRPRSLIISLNDAGRIGQILKEHQQKVSVIVVTDGERILGLGDLGSWGMGIPVGKLALYTAMAGVNPETTLPVVIDAGTNNVALRNDPNYQGLKQPRESGQKFLSLVDEFVHAVKTNYPGAFLQFEDFGGSHAFDLLRRYETQLASFNDDIQGTAAVTLAGLLAAFRGVGGDRNTAVKFSKKKFLFLGAGQAAVGIADLIVDLILSEEKDITEAAARKQILMIDSSGLVHMGRSGKIAKHKQGYAHDLETLDQPRLKEYIEQGKGSLVDIIEAFRPQALIGVSGQGGTFTSHVIAKMAEVNPSPAVPVIFALSNPTANSECTAEEAYKYTNDRVLFASGSPFSEYTTAQGRKIQPGQANNCYVFPGIGLGVEASKCSRVTKKMVLAAAKALAAMVQTSDLAVGRLYPPLNQARRVSVNIATALATEAQASGVALERTNDWKTKIQQVMYDPRTKETEKSDL